MAEQVVVEVLPKTGVAPFKKIVKDLKPAVRDAVKKILDSCIASADLGEQEPESTTTGASAPPTAEPVQKKGMPDVLKKSKDPKNSSIKSRPNTAVPMTAERIHKKLNQKPLSFGVGKSKKGEEETTLNIIDVGRKDKRNEADKKKRWHPEEIRDDYVEKLKTQTKGIFGETMATKMFSPDFKNHVKCLKIFKAAFDDENLADTFLDVVDIVIKWAYIKSNEISNIAFLKELYNFFDELVDFLISKEYQFLEAEGTILCLCLVEKIGMNNNIMKEKIKEILMKIGNTTVFFPKKVMSILIKGLASKNAKTTAECLECIANMVQIHQLEVINEKDVKTIAIQCESADNGIRQSALQACEEIYKITGEQFWTLVGKKLSTKAADIIRARLNVNLGAPLNSTPVEEKKEHHRNDKSPMGGNKLRSSGLNRSLNKSMNNKKLNSSIPLSDSSRGKLGSKRKDSSTGIASIGGGNLSKSHIAPGMATVKQRMSSSSRLQTNLDPEVEKEISKIEEDGEIVPEILLMEEDPTMEQNENLDTIGKNIKQLKYGDLSGKVDTLVIINELITKKMEEAKESLIKNADFLIDAISKVLYDVFNKTADKVPLKFGKYFISIVTKVCSIKEIMRSVEERRVLILVEQLLLKLLIPGLDTLGERKEGEAMFRNLNNSILRILENCHPTEVFVVFLTLLKKYKGYNKIEKLSGIIVKCLLKVTRIMDQIVDKLNIERILLIVHEYLLTGPNSSSARSDDVGIRITKTIINELVKLKKDTIWDYYGGVEAHSTQDVYIRKWIEIILASLNGGEAVHRPKTASEAKSGDSGRQLSDEEYKTLSDIIGEAQCGNRFRADQAYKNIVAFSDDVPGFDLESFLRENCTAESFATIWTGVTKARKRIIKTGKDSKVNSHSFRAPVSSGLKTPNRFGRLDNSDVKTNRLSTIEKMQEYEEKRANLRQKYGSKKHQEGENKSNEDDESASSSLKPEGENKLGSSIAAMNSSITEKWRKINSKGLKTHGPGLNNTVGGGFKSNALQDKSTLDKDSNDNEADQDVNKSNKTKLALQARLNEVKARLGNLKKGNDKR